MWFYRIQWTPWTEHASNEYILMKMKTKRRFIEPKIKFDFPWTKNGQIDPRMYIKRKWKKLAARNIETYKTGLWKNG